MLGPNIGIKRMIVGGLCIVFAAAVWINGTDAGDLEGVYGELKWDKAAVDSDTGVTADSPVLLRVVEMYQYQSKDLNDDGEIDYEELMRGRGFSESHEPRIKVKGAFKTYKWYKNPQFPKGFNTRAFYGKAKISGVRLDQSLIRPLSNIPHKGLPDSTEINDVRFKKKHQAVRLTDLPSDGGKDYGLVLREDGTYTSSGAGDEWEVGDLRVCYYIVDKDTLGKFTACGTLEDGVLGPGKDDSPVFLYDTKVSAEEVAKQYEGSGRKITVIFLVIGILLAVWGVIAFIRSRSEEKSRA